MSSRTEIARLPESDFSGSPPSETFTVTEYSPGLNVFGGIHFSVDPSIVNPSGISPSKENFRPSAGPSSSAETPRLNSRPNTTTALSGTVIFGASFGSLIVTENFFSSFRSGLFFCVTTIVAGYALASASFAGVQLYLPVAASIVMPSDASSSANVISPTSASTSSAFAVISTDSPGAIVLSVIAARRGFSFRGSTGLVNGDELTNAA